MNRISIQQLLGIGVAAGSLVIAAVTLGGQSPARDGEWRTWGGDLANTRYRPFDQINASNFAKLESRRSGHRRRHWRGGVDTQRARRRSG
jgi:hypothetical protein